MKMMNLKNFFPDRLLLRLGCSLVLFLTLTQANFSRAQSAEATPSKTHSPRAQAIFFGGYDFNNAENIFRGAFEATAIALDGWQKKIFFAGPRAEKADRGDPWSRYEIADAAQIPVEQIKSANQANLIEALQNALSGTSRLNSGDRLLLYMHAHGSQMPHLWSVDEGTIDPQILRPYLVELKTRGIKLGIIDSSCYSGVTADQFSDLACVLAGAPDDTYACSEIEQELQKQSSQKNRTLESLFLSTLTDPSIMIDGSCHGIPQISALHRAPPEGSLGARLNEFKELDSLEPISKVESLIESIQYSSQHLHGDNSPLEDLGRVNALIEQEREVGQQIERLIQAPLKVSYEIPPFSFFSGKSVVLQDFLKDQFACRIHGSRGPVRTNKNQQYFTGCQAMEQQQQISNEQDEAKLIATESAKIGNTVSLEGFPSASEFSRTPMQVAEHYFPREKIMGFHDSLERDQFILAAYSVIQQIDEQDPTALRRKIHMLNRARSSLTAQIKVIQGQLKTRVGDLRQYEGQTRAAQYLNHKNGLLQKEANHRLSPSESKQLRQIKACAGFAL